MIRHKLILIKVGRDATSDPKRVRAYGDNDHFNEKLLISFFQSYDSQIAFEISFLFCIP